MISILLEDMGSDYHELFFDSLTKRHTEKQDGVWDDHMAGDIILKIAEAGQLYVDTKEKDVKVIKIAQDDFQQALEKVKSSHRI